MVFNYVFDGGRVSKYQFLMLLSLVDPKTDILIPPTPSEGGIKIPVLYVIKIE